MINANPEKYRVMDNEDLELGDISKDFIALADRKKAPKRVKTGLQFFDSETESGFYGGLPQGLSFFGGRTGSGKTTFFWQLASNMSNLGTKVIYFSFEMSRRSLLAKSICFESLDYGAVVNGLFGNNEVDLIKKRQAEVWDKIKNIRIYYRNKAKTRFTASQMVDVCEKELGSSLGQSAVIMVDYLQLIAPPEDGIQRTDKEITNYNMVKLMELADNYKVPVLCISSLNRASYQGKRVRASNNKPEYIYYEPLTLSSFKESGEIEYNATCCFTLEPMQKEFSHTGIKLRTLKNRYGSCYSTVIEPD